MIGWLNSYHTTNLFGIGIDYIISAVMVVGGLYLGAIFTLPPTNPVSWILRPLRYVGYALVVCGAAYGYGTFRESTGAARCQAAWKQKNYELRLLNMQRDLAAQKAAAAEKAAEAEELAKQKQEADDRIQSYATYAAGLSDSLSSCRRATPDDDRRLCDIIGNGAPGCRASH